MILVWQHVAGTLLPACGGNDSDLTHSVIVGHAPPLSLEPLIHSRHSGSNAPLPQIGRQVGLCKLRTQVVALTPQRPLPGKTGTISQAR